MKLNSAVRSFMPALLLTLSASGLAQFARAQQTDTAIRVLENELGGVVTGPNGPEAGVWVIAETTDLPTKFARSSSPTRAGPLSHSRSSEGELQRLGARLWSRRFRERRGRRRAASSTSRPLAAPSEKDAAQYYPAMYWYVAPQCRRRRANSRWRRSRARASGSTSSRPAPAIRATALGTPGMRTISQELGQFQSSTEAWTRRLMSGGAQMFMVRDIDAPRHAAGDLTMFADWTDRVAAGELPFDKPARPARRRAQRGGQPVGLGEPHHLPA